MDQLSQHRQALSKSALQYCQKPNHYTDMYIQGLSHLTFVVRDLERSAALWREALGAVEVYDSGQAQFSLSREKFFTLGGMWIALMEGEPISTRNYRHIAFKVDDADLPGFRQRLEAQGVEIKEGRSRVEGEGQSLYFYDFDNHLFELHGGTLERRLARYADKSAEKLS